MTKKTIPQKANLQEEVTPVQCEDCFEEYLFHLRDSSHDFTIGLLDILSCLKFAEENGAVPELPADWWNNVTQYYGNFDEA